MAAKTEKHISLNLMIDIKNNKVVFAECNGDFVDILLGFLALPMGTVVRLVNKQPSPEIIGSFTSLYRGVTELGDGYLRDKKCKTMLLCPNNSSETVLQKLKINIDDTMPTKYFTNLYVSSCTHFSVVNGVQCPCNRVIADEIFLKDSPTAAVCEGVFVNPNDFFIITDDLQVMPASSSVICSLLEVVGKNDWKSLQQKTVNVDLDQICDLLKISLLSKSTLTDMFLRDQCIQFRNTNSWPIRTLSEYEVASDTSTTMCVKLIVRKTDEKVIYAETNEDFIDLLFSLLTIPVGLVVELLGGNSSVTCVDNLYKSVDMLINSNPLKENLVTPKLAPLYLCKTPLLDVVKHNFSPKLYCSKNSNGYYVKHISFFENVEYQKCAVREPIFVDQTSADGHKVSTEGYVRKRASFMVTDDLVVTPFSSSSMICLLQSSNMTISCVEERVIHVGKEEALSLLQASLISSSALTSWISGFALATDLNVALKKPKQEPHAP